MLKRLNVIHLIIEILIAVVTIIMFIVFGIKNPNSLISLLVCLTVAHPLLYLVMMVIKEAKIVSYDTPKFAPFCMGLTILLGCIIWYLFFHLEFNFINTVSLWYALVLFAFFIPLVIAYGLTIIDDKKKDKFPKIIRK